MAHTTLPESIIPPQIHKFALQKQSYPFLAKPVSPLADPQHYLAFQIHYNLSIFVPSDFLLSSGIRIIMGLLMEARRSNAEDRDSPVVEVIGGVRSSILREVEDGGLVNVASSDWIY